MDVTFEREGGKSFSIEVGFFNSFLEVKEKVEKYRGIPVSIQTLFLNGQLLQDHDVIFESQIRQDSRILLRVTEPPPPPPPQPLPLPLPTRIKFHVKIAKYRSKIFILEMNVNDTVLKLKEKIHDKRKYVEVKAMRLRLGASDQLLDDHQLLRDSGISANSYVHVDLKQPQSQSALPTPAAVPVPVKEAEAASDGGSKNLTVIVRLQGGTYKIPIDVKACDKVEHLKMELKKLHKNGVLPQVSYYDFFHKQRLMNENMSFQEHNVEQGDTIDTFGESLGDQPKK